MTNAERILFGVVLFIGGAAAGMYYEHQRFLKEIQGISRKHADAPTPQPPPIIPDPPPSNQPEAAA